MATAISLTNGKNGLCQVNSDCRNIHLDFPFLHFRLTVRNSILAHRCRLAYANCGSGKSLYSHLSDGSTPRPAESTSSTTWPELPFATLTEAICNRPDNGASLENPVETCVKDNRGYELHTLIAYCFTRDRQRSHCFRNFLCAI